MILFPQFGYALRHCLRYNPKSTPGSLRLWSSYNGSLLGTDPIKNGDDPSTEFLSQQYARGSAFGSNIYVSVSIGNDDDLFSILAASAAIKDGEDYSFKNYAGRLVSFSRAKASDKNYDIVLVNIRHKTDVGTLTLKEVDELELVARDILVRLGYSDQSISEKVKRLKTQTDA